MKGETRQPSLSVGGMTRPGKSSTILLPIITGSLLSGLMSALSLFAVPVLLKTTTNPAQLYYQWVSMYGYGHQVLPGLAILTAILYFWNAVKSPAHRNSCIAAGIFTVAIIPFTLIFMVPTNDKLFALHADAQAGNVRVGIEGGKELVKWWSQLHLMRSVMPLAGAILGVSSIWE